MAKYNFNVYERNGKDKGKVDLTKIPTTGPGPDVVQPPKPQKPRKSLDERIMEAVSKALVPVITRLDKQDTRFERIEARLDEQGKDIKVIQSDISELKTRVTKIEDTLVRNKIY